MLVQLQVKPWKSVPELTFVNVIDPVVDYLASLSPQKVGLLGTRATVRSAYTKLAAKNSGGASSIGHHCLFL